MLTRFARVLTNLATWFDAYMAIAGNLKIFLLILEQQLTNESGHTIVLPAVKVASILRNLQ
jgi:hypothetical protein